MSERRKRVEVTKEELVEAFWECHRALGHQPSVLELMAQGKYGIHFYRREYGNWTQFLHSIGLDTLHIPQYTPRDLVSAFWECHRAIGHQPTTNEINAYGKFSLPCYLREYGNWTKFLQSLGLKTQSPRAPSRKELTEAFWECHLKLGRQPASTEIGVHGKYGLHSYAVRYGSWTKFLKSLGLDSLDAKAISPKDLNADYDRVKKRLGKIPTRKEMFQYGKYSVSVYENRFGNFTKYQRSRNDRVLIRKNVTRKDLIADFEMVKEKLGRVPTAKEIQLHGRCITASSSIIRLFGGYNAFLKKRKEKTPLEIKSLEHIKNVTSEFYRVKKKLGRIPTIKEFESLTKYFQQTVFPAFGTWNAFVRSLGETPYSPGAQKKKAKSGSRRQRG